MGENIDSIREELEAEQRKQYSNFTIKIMNKVGPLYTKHCIERVTFEQKLVSIDTIQMAMIVLTKKIYIQSGKNLI